MSSQLSKADDGYPMLTYNAHKRCARADEQSTYTSDNNP